MLLNWSLSSADFKSNIAHMVQIIAFSSETVQNKKVKIISPSGFLQSEKKKVQKWYLQGFNSL